MNESKIQVGLKKLPIHLQSSQNRILIKGGKIVNEDRAFLGDVYIEDGVIKQVGNHLTIPGGVRVIDAMGKLILPGGVDPNTHFQASPTGALSCDDFYCGTRAALAGGTTTIIDFVSPTRGVSLLKMYDQYREWADNKVCCDYALHVIVPQFNDQVSKEMEVLVQERGVNSFMIYFGYADRLMLEDDEALDVLQKCIELGAVALVHAENGNLVKILQDELFKSGVTGPEGHLYSHPESAEIEATGRAITLADSTLSPLYITKVMSEKAAKLISQSRFRGSLVIGEAIAAALGTDGRNYTHTSWHHAAGYVMSPPLRPDPSVSSELMHCLGHSDLEVVASDHCGFKTEQKALGKDDFRLIPNGVSGVEDRMSIVWEKGVVTGILDPCKFVAVTSSNAAKVFNLYPRKGRIDVGSDADLVIWNPDATRVISAKTHHQATDFNIFEGMCCHGVPVYVLSAGRVVVDDGDLRVTQGAGRYLPSAPFPPYLYDRLDALKQSRAVKPVIREPYTGSVATEFLAAHHADMTAASLTQTTDDLAKLNGHGLRTRPPTNAGGRNMQDSSFSFSGSQIDDKPIRTSVRTKQPPGGASTSLW